MNKKSMSLFKKLEKNGYAVLKKKLSKRKCLHFKKVVEAYNKKFLIKNKDISFYFNVLNLDKSFFKLVFDKELNQIAKIYFSYKKDKKINSNLIDYHLNYIHLRNLARPVQSQKLHIDGKVPGLPKLILLFIIYLDDVNEDNGPTSFVPGSHKINRLPEKNNKVKTKKILGKQGTIIAFDGSTWHGSSEKNNYNSRSILLINFSRWFVTQNFAMPFLLPKKIINKLNEKEKRLLGFYDYPAVLADNLKIKKNFYKIKNNLILTGDDKKVNSLSRSIYRKSVQDYKFEFEY